MQHSMLLLLHACTAAACNVQPHLFIQSGRGQRRLMNPIMKVYTGDPKKRGKFNAAVFMNLEGGVFVYTLTGTRGCSDTITPFGSGFQTMAGKTATSMTKKEYLQAVQAALQYYEGCGNLKDCWAQMTLVQDNAPTHPKPDAHGMVKLPCGTSINARNASARSPDMMPLDYYLFGRAKRLVAPRHLESSMWQARAQAFYMVLLNSDTKAAIQSFPKRLNACILAKGEHFERV